MLWLGEIAEDTGVIGGVFDSGFLLCFQLTDLLLDHLQSLLNRPFGVKH